MKKYAKPEMEVIKLRVEERIASCEPFRLISESDWTIDTCMVAQPIDNVWTADCYDISDCS